MRKPKENKLESRYKLSLVNRFKSGPSVYYSILLYTTVVYRGPWFKYKSFSPVKGDVGVICGVCAERRLCRNNIAPNAFAPNCQSQILFHNACLLFAASFDDRL